jgi:hypothetical protein
LQSNGIDRAYLSFVAGELPKEMRDLSTSREPAQCHRHRHQLQKPAPVKAADKTAETRQLALDERSEFRRLRWFFERATMIPAVIAHRWHTPQSDSVTALV